MTEKESYAELITRQAKESEEFESTNDGPTASVPTRSQETKQSETTEKPDVDTSKSKEEWKDGYEEYEKKTKTSERLSFDEKDIKVEIEDIE